MSRQLRAPESGTRGVRRIIRKLLGRTLEALNHKPPLHDELVHDARKRLKEARAALRLLRPALGRRAFDRENACLRNAARPLTEVRDARVLLDALADLAKRFGVRADAGALHELNIGLQAHRREVRRRVFDGEDPLAPAKAALARVQGRLKQWPVSRRGWPVLGKGLRRVYRAGRVAFAAAQHDPSVKNLHEWRKQAKYLRYQLELLRPAWPDLVGEFTDQVHTLGETLGDDHDLAVLRQTLADADRFPDHTAVARINALIDGRRAELQEQAHALGCRVYEEKPRELTRRFGGYWHTWRAETKKVTVAE